MCISSGICYQEDCGIRDGQKASFSEKWRYNPIKNKKFQSGYAVLIVGVLTASLSANFNLFLQLVLICSKFSNI